MDYLDLAFDPRLQNQARVFGIESTLDVGVIEWKGHSFYHVSGVNRSGQRVLVEVFKVNAHGKLEAVLVYQYPVPIRDLYRN
ncbi:hypothetical protein [Cupriavidus consociatus]|uniref:hypothetical protein n=1 Tax=Cupriavidus consociatus TaxID=2821357 RepID=UPI001AE7B4CE|nr:MULTISPECIES: hypothetical protein [unclassified Cupriavidus]MBP0620851.1 hypothetical protein [Cupriavidus sp. LEh25]MDK2657513.1 hypothetical protein [Cupriavidus sp. LEh21]